MTRKKPGSKPKDSAITDNPNFIKSGEKPLTRSQIFKLKARQVGLKAKLAGEPPPEKEERYRSGKKKPPKKELDPFEQEAKELKIAQRMLEDLRYAYRNSVGKDGKKGRERLVELMQNDFEFKFAMKELMRIESTLLGSRAKENYGGGGNIATFVILKGLYDDDQIKEMIQDKTLDLEQISNALNPESVPEMETETVSQREAPTL